jgi:hypothetical protein
MVEEIFRQTKSRTKEAAKDGCSPSCTDEDQANMTEQEQRETWAELIGIDDY